MNLNQLFHQISHYCGLHLPVELGYSTKQLVESRCKQDTNYAESLAKFLSYRYYDEKQGLFFNEDSIAGFMLEISPIVGSSSALEKNLSLFFNSELPQDCYLQFLLVASNNIDNKLNSWRRLRVHLNPMLQQLTNYRQAFVRSKAQDFANNDGRMGRDFHIYCSFTKKLNNSKSQLAEIVDFKHKFIKKLTSIELSPKVCNAEDLIFIAGDLAGVTLDGRARRKYDSLNPISHQIFTPLERTVIKEDAIMHQDSGLVSKCFFPVSLPESFSLLEMIGLLGSDTGYSLPARLVISYIIASDISKTRESKILSKGHRAIHAAEQWYARHDTNLREEAIEWRDIIASNKSGERFLTESMQVMITSSTQEIATAQENLISLYNSLDWQLKINQNLQLPALLSMLPMQQSLYWPLLKHFKLTRLISSKEVVAKLPIHGEWKGMQESGVLLLGRRGELFNWNPFVRLRSGSYNVAVMAPSGSGKSVFLQELATSMLAQNKSVFVLDIGGSYQNICELIGGELLRFNKESKVSLNPFASLAGSGAIYAKALSMMQEGKNLEVIADSTGLSVEQITMLQDKTLKSEEGGAGSKVEEEIEVIKVGDYFVTRDAIIYAKSIIASICGIKGDAHKEAIIERAINSGIVKYGSSLDMSKLAIVLKELEIGIVATELSETLYPYTESGVHGRFFKSGSSATFENILTIFEFEEVKNDPVLLSVVLQVILMQVTMQFLCGDRSRQFLLIVDEAWMILEHSAKFLENFCRTVRKYGGSLVICVQNYSDFHKSAERKSILENSSWTVILKQDEKGLTSFKEADLFNDMLPLIESISLVPGKYAEMLLCATGLKVIGRLALDPYAQSLYSTDSSDFRFLQDARKKGISKDEAIKELAKKYGKLPDLDVVRASTRGEENRIVVGK